MVRDSRDLWSLVTQQREIDPEDLAHAVGEQVQCAPLDFRTRLLIRDSVEGLRQRWGSDAFDKWLTASPNRNRIEQILTQEFVEIGFPSLVKRLMEKTTPERIEQYLRELSMITAKPLKLVIGGSGALILSHHLSRHTEDIDVVDEVPEELRTQYKALDQLQQRYGLHLAHFQSHYLPTGWAQRLHPQTESGRLQVQLVDPYDIFVGKLFSARDKDRDDLRALVPQFDKDTIVGRLHDTTQRLQADANLKKHAETNWYILFGENLPQ